jgi:carbon-monoxide dehydrogenase medium subunit
MSRPLSFYQPTTLDEATELLGQLGAEAKVVAGGTAVTIMLRQRLIDPSALVSIGRLPDLDRIEVVDGTLQLGALVKHRAVELSPVVRAQLPVLARTFGVVANVRVRNAATVGGVLAEADYASDPPALFRALDAVVEATGPQGRRTIPIADFFVAFYETSLQPDELVTGVQVPLLPPTATAVYEKYVTRSSEDRPCIGVAAIVDFGPDGTCRDLRVAVGAAAETPQRFPDLEAQLRGQTLSGVVIRDLADAYADRIETLDDLRGSSWYRTEMVRVWVRRAIEHAVVDAGRAAA